ncbi:FAD-dependent oxidoreductase [Pyxidicoccus xibeiensis]|uniref:FAD-dependent oxidoreductase n=1 Tax=Pyxidicoccus xibeiensis TaxID=2906759 RepID=UPI0020A7C86A|nr:FAD-dependent oxidoreductase [Pyxidicoccus xibeiensis]MCP3144736.1 FAD-dependent oxidoreductase [Pyxidicoccus xibeiensis]
MGGTALRDVVGAPAAALARSGLRVTVLEARERVGGRVATVRDAVTDVPLELGAELVHGAPDSLRKLARRARLSVRHCDDTHALLWKGRFGDGDASFGFLAELAGAKPPDRPVAMPSSRQGRWRRCGRGHEHRRRGGHRPWGHRHRGARRA